MNKKEMQYIQRGIHMLTKEMRKINKELKKATSTHKKRFASSQSIMDAGIRRTDGRI